MPTPAGSQMTAATGPANSRAKPTFAAAYNGVEAENVVLGAGADDLLMLCARSYAGPGDLIAIADEPSYPLYRVAAWVTGAGVGDDRPVLPFVCRLPNSTHTLASGQSTSVSSSQ